VGRSIELEINTIKKVLEPLYFFAKKKKKTENINKQKLFSPLHYIITPSKYKMIFDIYEINIVKVGKDLKIGLKLLALIKRIC
jgi:hypothetical protein